MSGPFAKRTLQASRKATQSRTLGATHLAAAHWKPATFGLGITTMVIWITFLDSNVDLMTSNRIVCRGGADSHRSSR